MGDVLGSRLLLPRHVILLVVDLRLSSFLGLRRHRAYRDTAMSTRLEVITQNIKWSAQKSLSENLSLAKGLIALRQDRAEKIRAS